MLTAELSAELSARKKQYEYYRDQLLSFNNVRGGLTFANPESVRWMTLKDCCVFSRGEYITKKDVSHGDIPVILGGIEPAYYCDRYNHLGKCIVVSRSGANAGFVSYWDEKIFVTDGFMLDAKETVSLRYVYHCLKNKQDDLHNMKRGGGVPHISGEMLEKVKVPVPPIEIQNRIVKVLDNFDSICSDLQIGLPAEIDARKKQYEYYRDLLLSFEPIGTVLAKQASKQASKQAIISLYQYVYGYVEIMLGEVATISRGGNFQKKDFAESGVPCIHYGQIYTRYGLYADKTISSISNEAAQKQKFAQPNDIVMAVTSENVEDVCKCVAWVGNELIAVSGHSAIIHHNQNAKFLTYYFHTSMFFEQKRKLAHGTKVIEVTPDKLSDIKIPLPSLAEQERIVAVLDKFDALVNDLSEGLPAEIEARKRQYEYYRDKLLSFKKIA